MNDEIYILKNFKYITDRNIFQKSLWEKIIFFKFFKLQVNNMSEEFDSDFVIKDKIVQHTVNGISRFLILWIIMENGPIHGYGLLKELNIFFEDIIDAGSIRKSSPSRVYPILKDMEKNGLIKGETKISDNKEVRFYEITDAGEYLVYYIRDCYQGIKNTAQGALFSEFINDK